jgi:hypothetical protein
MVEFNLNVATTTDFTNKVSNIEIPSYVIDDVTNEEITYIYFDKAPIYLGYLKTIPQLKAALKIFSLRVAGQGWETESLRDRVILERIKGWGEDNFSQIIQNHIIIKKALGDAFIQIIRNDKGTLINLKPLNTYRVRIAVNKEGLINHYEYLNNNGKYKRLETWEVLHSCNDRMNGELHGTSIIEVLKDIIDAKNEAFKDERLIRHRDKALGIIYYKTDNTGKIAYANAAIEKAVANGEMVGLPEETATIQQFPSKSPADRILWLQYLDNLFYQVVGIPKILTTSEGYTEAGGKAGLIAFEPNEIAEKEEIESDIYNQIGIRIKFSRSPSILKEAQLNEIKNSGQSSIQLNEAQISASRSE